MWSVSMENLSFIIISQYQYLNHGIVLKWDLPKEVKTPNSSINLQSSKIIATYDNNNTGRNTLRLSYYKQRKFTQTCM